MWYLMYLYMRLALLCGFHRHVYHLVMRGKPAHTPSFYKMHELLVKRGYHECPICNWAMEKPNQHLEDKNSWCYEESLPLCPTCHEERLRNGEKECLRCATEDARYRKWAEESYFKEQEELCLAHCEEERKKREEEEAWLREKWRKENERGLCKMCGKFLIDCSCVSDGIADYNAHHRSSEGGIFNGS